MSNITIVLAADTGYAEQVHTLMKSVCTHNTGVNFYLMHNTFRKEWINYTNQKLAASGSRLNDVKIEMDFSQYRRLSHISDAAFFRLMMQHLPVDRALYLDSDMVVTQSLHDLFNLDMRGYPVAAVQDSYLARTDWNHPTGLHTTPYFNSGMLEDFSKHTTLTKCSLCRTPPRPSSTTPHSPNRGCAITARFLLKKYIGNTIALTGRKRSLRQGIPFPCLN